MSKNTCRMAGLIVMMISVFFIMGGLFLKGEGIPAALSPICLIAGLILLIAGVVLYRVLKNE